MKTLRFIGMAIVAIIMSVNFAACSDDDEEGNNGNNPLVGTWIDDDGSYEAIIWKFNADGTGIEQLTEFQSLSGNRQVTDLCNHSFFNLLW